MAGYVQNEGADGLATLIARFATDDRTVDLLQRKLARLIEVQSLDEMTTDCITCNRKGKIS